MRPNYEANAMSTLLYKEHDPQKEKKKQYIMLLYSTGRNKMQNKEIKTSLAPTYLDSAIC